MGLSTIRGFESGRSKPVEESLKAMRRALEAAGVIFVDQNEEGPGVRLRKHRVAIRPHDNGRYAVVVLTPGQPLPQVLPEEFATEGAAQAWVRSPEGTALIERVVQRYSRPADQGKRPDELNASNDD